MNNTGWDAYSSVWLQEVQRSGKAADKLQEWISVAQQASRSL